MSTKIQEALELPTLENLLKASAKDVADVNAEPEQDIPEEQDPLAMQLGEVLGTGGAVLPPEAVDEKEAKDHADSMDHIYEETLQHAKDLMDLGYNVDTRSAGRIFENSANMFKIALEAKNSKRKAQLDRIKLEMKMMRYHLA
jgi:sugar diacid utilization regulator